MKNRCRVIFFTLALFLFLSVPLFGQEGGDQDIRRAIAEMEARLLVPCEPLETLMGDMIYLGLFYQKKEGDRAVTYHAARQKYVEMVGEFVVASDKDGKAPVGKFMEAFTKLKERVAAQGILADGVRPGGATIAAVRNQQTAKRYFYFEEPGSPAANNRLDLRDKAQEDYEKLIAQWKEARENLYKQFGAGGVFAGYDDDLRRLAADMEEDARQYGNKKKAMTALAATNEYEHCLGKLTIKNYTLQSGNPLQLYMKQEKGTEGAIPGMGFNLMKPAPYPALVKPDIGEFPLALHLKFNGSSYLKMEKELLEIRLKAEEEATLAVALGMGDTGAFLFGTGYKITEGLAAPVQLVKDITIHPFDTIENVCKLVSYVANTPVYKLDSPGTLIASGMENFAAAAIKLKDAGFETVKNIYDSEKFKEKPGETLEQSIDRLQGKYDSVLKVKAGVEVVETLISETVQFVLDAGAGKGLDLAADAYKYVKGGKKAAETLKKVEDLEKQAKVLKVADAVSPDLEKAAAKVKELAKEQSELIENIQNFLNGKNIAKPGKALAEADLGIPLKYKDAAGNEVVFPVAKDQLGKGASTKAWISGDNDAFVVRDTPHPVPDQFNELDVKRIEQARFLDEYGRKAVDNAQSSVIRTAKREKSMDLIDENGAVHHVEIAERVKPAKDWLKEQGGQLTEGQKLALEQGTRDLNAKGLAWLDNHTGNYAFEKLPGQDSWGVVIHDTGGIYPMKGATAADMAENARALQNTLNKGEKWLKDSRVDNPEIYRMYLGDVVYQVAGDAEKGVDLAKVNLTRATAIPLGVGPGMRPDIGDIYEKSRDDVAKEFNAHANKAIFGDPEYLTNKAKLDACQENLIKETKGLTDMTALAQEKLAEKIPQAPPVPDKPPEVNSLVAGRNIYTAQEVALAIEKEACAGYRKAMLSGIAAESIMDAYKRCVEKGW